MIIAIDFDGTCVEHAYPIIGKDIGAVPVLKAFIARGDKLILHTIRSGKELADAIAWFDTNEITLYGVNENPNQHTWSDSKKPYAHVYIDDAALGAPLQVKDGGRPYIDWRLVRQMLLTTESKND